MDGKESILREQASGLSSSWPDTPMWRKHENIKEFCLFWGERKAALCKIWKNATNARNVGSARTWLAICKVVTHFFRAEANARSTLIGASCTQRLCTWARIEVKPVELLPLLCMKKSLLSAWKGIHKVGKPEKKEHGTGRGTWKGKLTEKKF